MSGLIDLHSHSTASDGTLTPTQLVQRASEQGVSMLALTDHDATTGIDEARLTAQELGIRLIAGVEISVSWRRETLHILGLNIDTQQPDLIRGLSHIRDQRAERARKIADKLAKQGITDAWSASVSLAGTEAVTRTHFARLLIERGMAGDMKTAFKRWLGRKGKAFVKGEWASLEQAVGWITAAGGQAVIAHPARYRMTHTRLGELIEEFKTLGGTGMEVVSSSYNRQERSAMASICCKHELLASVGSDFHTPGNPRIELGRGLGLPEQCVPIWKHAFDHSTAEPEQLAAG